VAALASADPDLQVWDGPVLTGDASEAVFVGFDGLFEGEETSTTTQQQWASGIGQNARDEDNQVTCAVVVVVGNADTSWKPTRDRVYAILDVVGEALRADSSLGLPPPSVAELMPGDYFQEPTENGFQGRLVFSVHHKTRV